QHPEKFIPTIIRYALAGKDIPIYGTGQQARDWIFVGDHVDGLLRAAEAGLPGQTYLFGAGKAMRNDVLCRLVCSTLNILRPDKDRKQMRSRIIHVEDRPGHDPRYAINPKHVRRTLGWVAATPLEKGLGQTIAWYLRNPAWLSRHSSQLKRFGLVRKRIAEGGRK
ncbi:MAG: GDP-mannose 4,6-dehydratase, partial [Alphaproteobacteria bacterium]|nr:GDP-mannose 4,6-dehydratase [Alphaproteobacteria bacterium]